MGATLLAILIIAHELARPIEKLRDYALSQNYPNSEDNVPPLSNIRELNQLTASVQEMLNHLKAWGKEIESSWQEAQNANKLKTEFLATTSHELRTPLNGIINCIRIVKDDYCDSKEEADDFLQKADDAAIHLLGIINDILEVSRIESGKLSVTCEPIELKRILKEVINIQLIQIKKKQLQLILYDQQNDLTIYADPAKLKQVLINVLGNAIKFTESGSINISTHVREARVIISVKDTGIGIEPRDQPKLFRPFVMIDGSTTRRFGGTGLGLAISKNLMQMMMGDITLFSNGIGQGTTVGIIIPLAETIKTNPENGQVKKGDYLLSYSSKEGTDTTFP
jgi:signal transduction histidine kinase